MAVSAKDSKLLEQKDLISQLNTTIAAQTELIQSLKKDHEADRETYKCPACSTADEMEENIKFVKAAVPEALIPNSYASGSAVAWVMYQKFANAMPLYRQEQDWHQLGVDFTRATLANWIIYCADNYFKLMYDYFHRQLLRRKYLMADETRIQVLKEPERNPDTRCVLELA